MKSLASVFAFAGSVFLFGFCVSGCYGDREMERSLSHLQQQNHGFTYSSSSFSGWGLKNARTSTGRLFSYSIPIEQGTEVLVVEHGKTQLPDWLHLSRSVDPSNNKDVLHIEGVSGPLEKGKRFYVEVSYGHLNNNNSRRNTERDEIRDQHSESQDSGKNDLEDTVKQNGNVRGQQSESKGSPGSEFSDDSLPLEPFRDIFAIDVVDDIEGENVERVNEAAESVWPHGACLKEGAMTTANVIIDDDFYKMTTKDRVSLVDRFCRQLGLSSQLVQLLPRENERPLVDADWLVAGPGDTIEPTEGHAGVMLQWRVGCNYVLANQMPALETLERTVQDGSFGKAVGRGVIGWHVTKKNQQLQRLKRQIGGLSVLPTGTPIVRIHLAPTAKPVPTATVVNSQESSASVGPGMRPSSVPPQASLLLFSRRLANISSAGKKASRNRQSGKSGLSKEGEGRKSLAKYPALSSFATPTVVSVRPTRVLHVGTMIVEEDWTSLTDEGFVQNSVPGFSLQPSKPYLVSKSPEATASLPISRSRHFSATSEAGMAVAMTTSYSSIYAQAATVTEPTENVVFSESLLSLTTTFPPPGNLSPAHAGVTETTPPVRKYSEIEEEEEEIEEEEEEEEEEEQIPEKFGSTWDGAEQPPITIATTETTTGRQTTSRSGRQVDDALGWLSPSHKAEVHTSIVNYEPQDYEFTSRKSAKYRQQDHLSTEAQRQTKTVNPPKKAQITTAKLPSADTTLIESKVEESFLLEATTTIGLTSAILYTELPTPKGTMPLKLYAPSTVTRIGSWQLTPGLVAFGGRRRLTTLPSTVMPKRRLTSPISYVPSTRTIRKIKTSKRFNQFRRTTRTHKKGKTAAPNYAPVVLHELGNLDVLVGSVFRFRIPNDTFLDEDGPTDKLRLLLETYDSSSWPSDAGVSAEDVDRVKSLTTVPPNSWVKLNSSTQLLYGLPTEEHFGPHEYWLTAVDQYQRLTKTRFEIHVRRRLSEDIATSLNHKFLVVLQLNYEMVIRDVDKRIDIVRRISSAYRDRSTDHMTVTGMRRGSVKFYWTNSSVQTSPCPVKTLTALRDHIISSDGRPTQTLVRAMDPYVLKSAEFLPLGGCLSSFRRPPFRDQEGVRPVAMMTTATAVASDEEVRKKPKESEEGNFLLYILIPMVILAAGLLLLLVLCIVCHGCRQRRKKKTRQNKGGIPVIFTEEMAADRPPSNCPRPVLADEVTSPFMQPPPTYSQSLPGSRFSTMRSNYKSSDDDSSSGLSSDAERFNPRSTGQSFPDWSPGCGPPPPYIEPYQPRYV